MKKALLLVNQHSRKGQKLLSQATVELEALGFELIIESTDHARELSDTIRRYQNRVELVIIGGGDGTLNAAIEGLIDTKLPLGILPMGTANDLARTLGIPTDLSAACQVIASGKVRLIDLGWVNGQHFFNVASLGLSVEITQRLTKNVKQRWGVLAYAFIALLPAMRQGNHTSWPNVRALYAQEFEVNTSKRRPINTDGEITTHTPAQFRVIPQALAVIAPS